MAAQTYIESVGGNLHGFWYAFGTHDGYNLLEAPDNVSMAAVAIAISGGSVDEAISRPSKADSPLPGALVDSGVSSAAEEPILNREGAFVKRPKRSKSHSPSSISVRPTHSPPSYIDPAGVPADAAVAAHAAGAGGRSPGLYLHWSKRCC